MLIILASEMFGYCVGVCLNSMYVWFGLVAYQPLLVI